MQPLKHFWIASIHEHNSFVHFYVVIVNNACIFKMNALFSLFYGLFLQPINIALPPFSFFLQYYTVACIPYVSIVYVLKF